MEEDNIQIESVTFYKQAYHSTQIYEKTITSSSLIAISLPRVKFLEKDGEYRPSWAVDKNPEPVKLQENIPTSQVKVIRKETYRRHLMASGAYDITPFEQVVHDMLMEGTSPEDICKKLNKRMSAVSGAQGRYRAKTLAKANKK